MTVKTLNGISISNIKTIDSVAIANVKTFNGISFAPPPPPPPPPPGDFAFIDGQTAADERNDFAGEGMRFAVQAAAPITITSLGRFKLTGNSGTHTLSLYYDSGSGTMGTFIASCVVNLSTGSAGTWIYTALASPVTLAANASLWLVSSETIGGDTYYAVGNIVNTPINIPPTTDAYVIGSVFDTGAGVWANFQTGAYCWGALNFKYHL